MAVLWKCEFVVWCVMGLHFCFDFVLEKKKYIIELHFHLIFFLKRKIQGICDFIVIIYDGITFVLHLF